MQHCGVMQHMYSAFKQYSREGGYLNSPSRELIANCDSGSKYPDAAAFDDQANGMVKVTHQQFCSEVYRHGCPMM